MRAHMIQDNMATVDIRRNYRGDYGYKPIEMRGYRGTREEIHKRIQGKIWRNMRGNICKRESVSSQVLVKSESASVCEAEYMRAENTNRDRGEKRRERSKRMEGLGRPAERGAGEAQLQSAQEVTAEPEGA